MIKRLFKRALIFLVAAALTAATPVSAEYVTPQIRVLSTVCDSGESVAVRLWLSGNTGLVTLRLDVWYDDTYLTLDGVSDGGIMGDTYHSDTLASPYTLYWANDTATEDFTGDGLLAELHFTVSPTAVNGEQFTVTPVFYAGDNNAFDKNLNALDIDAFSGTVTVQNKIEEFAPPFSYTASNGMISVGGIMQDVTDIILENSYTANGEVYAVSQIGDYAFAGNTVLQSVVLPETLTAIGQGAFLGCSALEIIDIPDSVGIIGDAAFDGCGAAIYCYPNSSAQTALSAAGTDYIIYGDLVPDLIINAGDIAEMKRLLLTDNQYKKVVDITRDDIFNILDFIRLKKVCAGL